MTTFRIYRRLKLKEETEDRFCRKTEGRGNNFWFCNRDSIRETKKK